MVPNVPNVQNGIIWYPGLVLVALSLCKNVIVDWLQKGSLWATRKMPKLLNKKNRQIFTFFVLVFFAIFISIGHFFAANQ